VRGGGTGGYRCLTEYSVKEKNNGKVAKKVDDR
jgi:hypothetical protein